MQRAARRSLCIDRRLAMVVSLLYLIAATPAVACSVSVAPLVFGAVDPLSGADSDSATSVAIDCDGVVSYSIALSSGGGMALERVMTSGSATLAYNLYSDASHGLVWGDGTAGTVLVDGIDPGTGSTHTVYARIPPQPQAVPGTYGDSIVVTVSF